MTAQLALGPDRDSRLIPLAPTDGTEVLVASQEALVSRRTSKRRSAWSE